MFTSTIKEFLETKITECNEIILQPNSKIAAKYIAAQKELR